MEGIYSTKDSMLLIWRVASGRDKQNNVMLVICTMSPHDFDASLRE